MDYEIIKCDEAITLCTVSLQLQQSLVAHFQELHYGKIKIKKIREKDTDEYFLDDDINEDSYLQQCSCVDSILIQNQFMNHLLSHAIVPKEVVVVDEEEIEIGADLDDEIIEEVVSDTEQHLEIEVIYNEDIVVNESSLTNFKIENVKSGQFFQCLHCSMKYKTFKAFSNHMYDEHDEANPLRCQFPGCNNRFKNERKLKAHKNRHEAEESMREDGQYYCRVCEKLCLTKDLLIAHLLTHNQCFSCDYCGKFFSRRALAEKHILQHVYGRQKVEKKKVLCELCSQMIQSDRMKRHIYAFHSNAKNYKCNECGKEFKYANSLKDHLDIHQNTPRYKCSYCSRLFFNSTNYKNHLLRHTNPDKFKCDVCEERFVNAKSLSQHMQRKHDDDKPKEELHCPYEDCDKFYFIEANLKSHIRRVHNSPRPNIPQNCSECKFTANSTKNLQRHMWRVHKVKQRNHRVFSVCQ